MGSQWHHFQRWNLCSWTTSVEALTLCPICCCLCCYHSVDKKFKKLLSQVAKKVKRGRSSKRRSGLSTSINPINKIRYLLDLWDSLINFSSSKPTLANFSGYHQFRSELHSSFGYIFSSTWKDCEISYRFVRIQL